MSILKTTTNGSVAYVRFTAAAALANLNKSGVPFTYAAVVSPSQSNLQQDLLYAAPAFPWSGDISGGLGISAQMKSGCGWSDDSTQIAYEPDPALAVGKWYILVATNTSPGTSSDLTLYIKNLTDATAWEISGALTGLAVTASTTDVSIGNGGASDFGTNGASWALVGIWAGVALSSAQVQALSTNMRTSDWYGNAGGHPDFLVECTSLTTLTDIGAHPSAYVANSNLSLVADTSGWNFNGQGGGGAAKPARPTRVTNPTAVNRAATWMKEGRRNWWRPRLWTPPRPAFAGVYLD